MRVAPSADDLRFATAQLAIRPLLADDAALYCGLYGDPETMRYVGTPLTAAQAARSFDLALAWSTYQLGKPLILAVTAKAGGAGIGICGLPRWDLANRRVEAGILLLAQARGRGLGLEGYAALVARTFLLFPIDEIYGQYPQAHRLAEKVVHRTGMQFRRDLPAGDGRPASRICSIFRADTAAPAV